MLADIYFNGAGVERNLSLAMHFACESDEATAVLALEEIAKTDSSRRSKGPFEFCDYAATTLMMNFCLSYEEQGKDDRRSRYYHSLASAMTRDQKAAFEKLLAAQKAYNNAHVSEVDQGGTIRVMRTIGSQGILDDLFHAELVHFEHSRWPVLSSERITMADALLHREYEKKLQQLHTRPQQDTYDEAVTADHLSSVEESWKRYRDAWSAFAALRYPSKVALIRAFITLDRCRLVKTIG